ncbi:tyrosine-type recombinase/integrase [Fundidesulfovibrio soli]|uniref:tyrosine-type recombinase/integrase n=1 Tax=Fundidesulfovibrio soli TaxID=2922716 RepID=UPI001FB0417F|nr:site-specific integrase [Fundidesulfovibrio soli]
MGYTWHQSKHEGVRYREHPTRKHGIKPDQYFAIRYRVDGKRHEEGLGWASQGWTAQKATLELSKLKEAHRTGEGAATLAEKRAQAEADRKARFEAEARKIREALTFYEFFTTHYAPHASQDKKASSFVREDSLFRHWISKAIGSRPLRMIGAVDLERLKQTMAKAKLKPRTIEYALAVVRQVYNHARRTGFYEGDSPTKLVKKPKVNNARLRYLEHAEANALLETLASTSQDTYAMALLSLHCGLRFGEIAALSWNNVDLTRKVLTLLDTKHGDRIVPMTKSVHEMLQARAAEGDSGILFPRPPLRPWKGIASRHEGMKTSGVRPEAPSTFKRAVTELGLNEGREDSRERVCFHTLRHTFASWHVLAGTDLYTLGKLMGHKTPTMTARYGHLSPEGAARATRAFEASMTQYGRGANVAPIGHATP